MNRRQVAIAVPVVAAAVAASFLWPYLTQSTVDEALPEEAVLSAGGPQDAESDIPAMISEEMPQGAITEGMPMEMPVVYAGTFVGVGDGVHHAEGRAYTVPLSDGSTILRLEDFRSTNGPALHVYLATDTSADDYVDLGPLKANMGNQNYEIPDGTDLDRYDEVLIWCKPFALWFGTAELSAG